MKSAQELMNDHRWCYYISELDFVTGRGYRVSILIEGEEGRYPTGDLDFKAKTHQEPWFWGMTYTEAEQTAAEMNDKLGLSVSDVVAIWMSAIKPTTAKRSRRSTKR